MMNSPANLRVAIIDCGAGNLHSVRKAFTTQLPPDATLNIVRDADALRDATHIVLPGVGAFADCMQGLNALPGMRDALEDAVLTRRTPFLGVCVGMQMLFERGEEFGMHEGLGWFKGEVRRLTPNDSALKIPHMGWNRLLPPQGGGREGGSHAKKLSDQPIISAILSESLPGASAPLPTSPRWGEECHPILTDIPENSFVYFVHSYAATGVNPAELLAVVDYGGEVVALIGRDNIVATQFHPEKSQAVGLRLIHNFLTMR